MAGCDGRMKNREYYRNYEESLPDNTVILPRVLDAGQCNDSFSLIRTAQMLQQILGLEEISDLPITFNLAWYEQKAVIVLLALLSLGVRDIQLGPTLPAFISPGIRKVLKENYGLKVPII